MCSKYLTCAPVFIPCIIRKSNTRCNLYIMQYKTATIFVTPNRNSGHPDTRRTLYFVKSLYSFSKNILLLLTKYMFKFFVIDLK